MKMVIKRFVALTVKFFFSAIVRFKIGRFFYEQIVETLINRTKLIEHCDVKLELSVPNGLTMYRADSFSSKEPETLDWIDGLPKESVLWDIGANVGLYSCYAAKKLNCRVFAFEPSVFNLEILARNIHLNELTDLVTIVPLPLSDELSINRLNMTSVSWGGAMSTFGQSYGHDGKILNEVFVIPLVGLSMGDAVDSLGIQQPDYIKMDVDGIEHLILKGGKSILEQTKGIIIEVNDEFNSQARDADLYLHEAGFELKEKLHAAHFDLLDSQERNTYNQIWIK
jgi:FkbM family methyltransferase